MLRIYICPQCYNFRMVSRKPDAICFHCGAMLDICDIEYSVFVNMQEEERNEFREKYKIRILEYQRKANIINQMEIPKH